MQPEQVIALREIYWNVPYPFGAIALYGLAIITTAVMAWGILRDIGRWGKGKPDARLDQIPARATEFIAQAFGQKKVLRDRRPGAMHALIFFGFLALFIGTDIIAVEEDFTLPLMGEEAGKVLVGSFYMTYEFIMDTLGIVFVVGLSWAALRRYRAKEARLDNRRTDAWVLAVLIFLGIGGFLIEGLRIANQCWPSQEECRTFTYSQSWAPLAYVGYVLALGFRAIGLGDGAPAALAIHQVLWFTHMLATFAFIGSLPFSKFKHIFYTPLNTFFRDTTPNGALDPIPALEAEIEKDEPRLGIATLGDLGWKHRLDLDACMRCGRCQANCPAHASGSDLSPKYIITKLHDLMRQEPIRFKDGTVKLVKDLEPGEGGEQKGAANGTNGAHAVDVETIPLYGNLFTENELWSCTTCYACVHECPAMIEHVDDIVGARRHLTMIASEVPQGVKRVLEGIERAGNPWRLPQRERTAWAAGLDVPTMAEKEEADVLYWVGCAPSYDERSKKVARALVQLMQQAGVDFAILGDEETCNGDPARRMGEELLYQTQVQTNVETMQQYKFKRIVTTCPHCFNTIKNEYPQFGGSYEVIHHTELLDGLVKAGKLKPVTPVKETVVYHDPCYLGRYNDVYDPPREILGSIPGLDLVEAPERNRERAMCCGGGGGNVWLEGWGKEGVNVIRLEQLAHNQPQTLAMSCPFCMVMFEDAAKNTGRDETLKRRDVAELLLEAVTPAKAE